MSVTVKMARRLHPLAFSLPSHAPPCSISLSLLFPSLSFPFFPITHSSERFTLPKSRNYEKQYSNLYFARLMAMRPSVLARATARWGQTGAPVIDSLMAVEPGKRCIVLGTLYKEMKLKPNILDEFQAREVHECLGLFRLLDVFQMTDLS